MSDDRPVLPGGDRGDADFDDPTHAPISELLASARVDTPVPADVAARLDATLAELTQDRRVASTPTEADPVVVPLRRRSRTGPRLLAAAAVVAVVGIGGVGLGQVLDGSGSDDASKAATAPAADSAGGVTESAPKPVPTQADGSAERKLTYLRTSGGDVPLLTAADFTGRGQNLGYASMTPLERAVRLADTDWRSSFSKNDGVEGSTDTGSTTGRGVDPTPQSGSKALVPPEQLDLAGLLTTAAKARTCSPPNIVGTASYPIVFDRQAALLVVHPAVAGTRLVQAWSCDGSEVLAFTTVPA